MADLIELSQWEPGIYQLETDDPVLGGADGIDNLQAKQLANRTKYLKEQVELRLTQPQVEALIAALVDSSPATLDTLNELAAALGDDPNFATTITNALALKAPLASPALTGNPTAPTQAPGTNNTTLANTAFVKAAVDAVQTVPDATETVKGKAEIATQAEVDAGTDDARFVTPLKLKNATSHGLGYGQTWQDVKASRSLGITYTNSTSKPILVLVAILVSSGANLTLTINGVNLNQHFGLSGTQFIAPISFVVPAGQTYLLTNLAASAIQNWAELR